MVQYNSSVLPVLIGKAKTADQEKKKSKETNLIYLAGEFGIC